MTCTFFGHKDAPDAIYPKLLKVVEELFLEHNVDRFLVGTHGSFDSLALKALRELKKKYPLLVYSVVLAYLSDVNNFQDFETIFPEGIEVIPKRFAITYRNEWMVRASDVVVCYIDHSWGGASQFVEMATKQGKEIINLAQY